MKANEALKFLGDCIKRHRLNAGLSQQEVADRINMDISQFVLLEAGQRDIDVVYVFLIAKEVNVSMAQFFVTATA